MMGWLQRQMRAVRRNHALEHATIAVLMGRVSRPVQLLGRATQDGFYILGGVQREQVLDSAHEALARLRRGESYLAVSPLCGTNLAVAGILAGLASFLATGRGPRLDRLPQALLLSVLAVLAAQPLGRAVQRHLTTLADVDGLEIVAVEMPAPGLPLYKVRTVWRDGPAA